MALVTDKGLGPSPAADNLATVAETLWTDTQTAEVQRQRQVRAERQLEAAAFRTVLPAEEGKPELAAQVAEEQEAEMRRQRALTTKHNRSAAVRAGPQLPDVRGMTVWLGLAVNDAMRNNQSSWRAPHRSPCAWWPSANSLISLWFKTRRNLAGATRPRH